MPKYRKEVYAIWRACERVGIRPPNVKESWDDTDVWTQCMLIAYSRIREYEESQEHENLLQASGARLR